jgi:mono/diheme cytochrome c family protein
MRSSAGAAVLAAAVVISACSGSSGLTGRELYEQSCASCHGGLGGGGVGPALDAGSAAESLTDEQIAGVIRVGPGSMPGFDHLTDEQIDSLVEYIRRLQE